MEPAASSNSVIVKSSLSVSVLFLNVYKRLPASADADHPHIIDTDSCDGDLIGDEKSFDVKIQDAVVTVLYKISKNILGQFLDGRTTSFKFVQWTEVGGVKGSKLIIWKKGSRFLVSGHARNT